MANKLYYEVWALGFDSNGCANDYAEFLGEFHNPSEAIEYAKNFEDLSSIYTAENCPSPEELGFMEIRVETLIPGRGCTNQDTIYSNYIYRPEEF